MRCVRSVFFITCIASVATAFDDDICFHDGLWNNCYARDTMGPNKTTGCGPTEVNDKSPGACGDWVTKMYFTLPTYPGRSTIHSDTTFLLAQMIGMKPDVAFWLTAYSEAVDKGEFRPLHRNGTASPLSLHPADLSGFNRFHICAGASEFHYVVRSSPPRDGVSVLSPPLASRLGNASYSDGDAQVLQTRKWAFGDSSTRLCVNGLTAPTGSTKANVHAEGGVDPSYYSGATCYCGGNFEVKHFGNASGKDHCVSQAIKWKPSFLGVLTWNLVTRNGDQPITFKHTNESNSKFSTDDLAKYYARGKKCKPDELKNLVWTDQLVEHLSEAKATGRFRGGAVPTELAKFGIYLHQLQDTYSHRTCYDNSYMAGPDEDGSFKIGYATGNGTCDTAAHVLHHYWEVGFQMHWPTTPAVLLATLLELRRFADSLSSTHPDWFDDQSKFSDEVILSALDYSISHPEWAVSQPSADLPEILKLLMDIVGALESSNGLDRIRALEDAAVKLGLVTWENALSKTLEETDGHLRVVYI